jgi:hypothetical protein
VSADHHPPKFLFAEVVRIVGATGAETDEWDDPLDVEPLMGREYVVQGAHPTDDQEDWIITLWLDDLQALCDFPEEALEATGLIELTEGDGRVLRVPLDPEQDRGWRDDVMVELETETTSEAEARAIAEAATAQLRGLVDVDELDWRLNEPFRVTLWVVPRGDALDAFERIVDSLPVAWQHDEDESVFISSHWERSDDGDVLVEPRVRAADVTYRRWTSPRRRSLRSGSSD